jgi:hypothetical protein
MDIIFAFSFLKEFIVSDMHLKQLTTRAAIPSHLATYPHPATQTGQLNLLPG